MACPSHSALAAGQDFRCQEGSWAGVEENAEVWPANGPYADGPQEPPTPRGDRQFMPGSPGVAQTAAGRMCDPGELFSICMGEVRNIESMALEKIQGLTSDVAVLWQELEAVRGTGTFGSGTFGSLRQARSPADLARLLQDERLQRRADVESLQRQVNEIRENSERLSRGNTGSDAAPQVLHVDIADIAAIRRDIDALQSQPQLRGTQQLGLQADSPDSSVFLPAMAQMEEAVASVRREFRVDQAEQEKRAQATQLAISLLRTDLSALKLSHEEALKDIQPEGSKAALQDATVKLTGECSLESAIRRSYQHELGVLRDQIQREHMAVRKQLAVLCERVEAFERGGKDALSDRFDEPLRLRGRVEALMTKSRTGHQSAQSLPSWFASGPSGGPSSSVSNPGQMTSARQQLQDSTPSERLPQRSVNPGLQGQSTDKHGCEVAGPTCPTKEQELLQRESASIHSRVDVPALLRKRREHLEQQGGARRLDLLEQAGARLHRMRSGLSADGELDNAKVIAA